MIRKINKFGSKFLSTPATPVIIPSISRGGLTSSINDKKEWPTELIEFAKDLTETAESMRNNCAGLAANQICTDEDQYCPAMLVIKNIDGWLVLVNPTVRPSGKKVRMIEGCLSNPGVQYKVIRRMNAQVSYTSLEFEETDVKLYGNLAPIVFALQHEMDHLNGITLEKIGKVIVSGKK